MNKKYTFEIDTKIAKKAESRLEDIGFNMNDAAVKFFKLLADEPKFSELLKEPNTETIEAIMEARSGQFAFKAKTAAEVFAKCGVNP